VLWRRSRWLSENALFPKLFVMPEKIILGILTICLPALLNSRSSDSAAYLTGVVIFSGIPRFWKKLLFSDSRLVVLMRALLQMWCVCREQVSGCFKSPPFRAVAIIHEQLSPPFRIFHLPCFLFLRYFSGKRKNRLRTHPSSIFRDGCGHERSKQTR